MKSKLSLFSFSLLVFLCNLASGAEEIDIGGIRVRSMPPLVKEAINPIHGQMELRLQLWNQTKDKRQITLSLENYKGDVAVARQVELEPGAQQNLSITEPGFFRNKYQQNHLKIAVPGYKSVAYPAITLSGGYSGNQSSAKILVSKTLNRDGIVDHSKKMMLANGNWLGNNIDGMRNIFLTTSYYGGKKAPDFEKYFAFPRSDFSLDGWSSNPIAYSTLDGVFISQKEWEQGDRAVRRALYDWMLLGGSLVVFGKINELPSDWKSGEHTPNNLKPQGFRDLAIGCGHLIEISPDVKKWSKEACLYLYTRIYLGTRAYTTRSYRGETLSELNSALGTFETLTIPQGKFLFLMLIYAILVGPVQIVWLRRKNRRIWMLWLTPLFSGFICVVMVIWGLFSSGITPRIRIDSLTILNQKTHEALSLSRHGYLAPFPPSEGIIFARNIDIHPKALQRAGKYQVVQNEAQQLVGDWLVSRTPAFFFNRQLESSRLRLDVRRDSQGDLYVVNAFGATITSLELMAADGTCYKMKEEIPPGAKQKLTASGKKENPSAQWRGSRLFNKKWGEWGSKTFPPDHLIPGTYAAELESVVFVKPALQGRQDGSQQMIIGFFQETKDVR